MSAMGTTPTTGPASGRPRDPGLEARVLDAAFSGKITIPADQSVIGKEFSIDGKSGDVTVKDMSIQQLQNNVETFLKPWPVTG